MLNRSSSLFIAVVVFFSFLTKRVDAYKCENSMLSSRTIANDIMNEMSTYLTTVPEDTLLFVERSHQRISSIYNFENRSPRELEVKLNTSLYVEFNIKVLSAKESVDTLFSDFKPSDHLDQIANGPKPRRWSLFRRNNADQPPPIKKLHSELVNLGNQVSLINKDLSRIQVDLDQSILLLSEGVERVYGAINRIEKGQDVYRTIFRGMKLMILNVQPDLVKDDDHFDDKPVHEQITLLINRLNNHDSPQWPRERIKNLDMILRHFLNFYHSLQEIRDSADELASYYKSQIEILKGMKDFTLSYSSSLVDIVFMMINDAVRSVSAIMEIQARLISLDINLDRLERQIDTRSEEYKAKLKAEKGNLNQALNDLIAESVELNDKTWDDNDDTARRLLEGRDINSILERLDQQHNAFLSRLRN